MAFTCGFYVGQIDCLLFLLIVRDYFQGYVGNDVMIHTSRAQIDKNECENVNNVLGPFHGLSSPNEKNSMPRGVSGTDLRLIRNK